MEPARADPTVPPVQIVCACLLLSLTLALGQELPSHAALQDTLREVVAEDNGGFGFHMWATVADRDGVVQAVTFSGQERGDQWPGSRVSADSSCTDHNIAWKVRDGLGLDHVPGGVSPDRDDNNVYDIVDGSSEGGYGHPECGPEATAVAEELPTTHPTGAE